MACGYVLHCRTPVTVFHTGGKAGNICSAVTPVSGLLDPLTERTPAKGIATVTANSFFSADLLLQ